MAYKIYTGDRKQLERALNGTVTLGPFPKEGIPVGALTLIFTTPVATVTFSGSAGDTLSLATIVSEINAQVAGLAAIGEMQSGPLESNRAGDGKVVPKHFLELTRAAGFTIGNTGTANSLFGIASTLSGPAEVALAKIAGFTAYQTQYTALVEL